MVNYNQFRSCKWLLEVIREYAPITLNEIKALWKEETRLSGGVELDSRNFRRFKARLKEEFGVNIICTGRGDYAYSISNPEILNEKNLGLWMLDTLAVGEKFHECMGLSDRIILEPIPSGEKNLDIVTDAMIMNKRLQFVYQKYGDPKSNDFEAGVCTLILYRRRWYILADINGKKKYTFSLDRMMNVKVTDEDYIMDPSFNVDTYFGEIYGIFNTGRDIQTLIIRAFGAEAFQMRDLPVHRSQKEIGTGDGYADFSLELRPNNELFSYIMSRREHVKILSPNNMIEEFLGSVDAIRNLYH